MKNLSKRTRLVLAATLATSAIATTAVVAPQFATAYANNVTATTALNVRSGPSTHDRILGVLAPGEQVERRGDPLGQWTPVRYHGQDAWVFSTYITVSDISSAAGGTATATDVVNVRADGSTLSRVLGLLRPGQSVSVTGGARGGWVPVSYNGRAAFIYGAYLNLNATNGNAAAPATPLASVTGSAVATTAVNVRQGASTNTRVLTVLRQGQSIQTTGDSRNGWTPVLWNGQGAFVYSQYLRAGSGGGIAASKDSYTTDYVNLRTGPGLNYRVMRVLSPNTKIALTGTTQGSWSQVNDAGTMRWISTTYLSDTPVSARVSPTAGNQQGPAAPPVSNTGTLNFGGSSGLDQLRPGAKVIVGEIRAKFPQINTMYGVRPDPLPDHPSGRAVDIMMPHGASDVALGNEIAAYLQANANRLGIEYLIWRQRIWDNGDGGWTPMADRGGITANHYDHVHVTIYDR